MLISLVPYGLHVSCNLEPEIKTYFFVLDQFIIVRAVTPQSFSSDCKGNSSMYKQQVGINHSKNMVKTWKINKLYFKYLHFLCTGLK